MRMRKEIVRLKEVILFPEIGWVKFFSSLTSPHGRMCIRIYIFLFKTNKKAHIQKQKAKESKEIRKIETKEEKKVAIVNNTCVKSIGVQ